MLPRKKDIFKTIRDLDESRDQWMKRTVATIDFSDGSDTYVEHITHDLDVELIHACSESKFNKSDYIYLPITWRKKETFLEFDALLNSGSSLQLVELKLRQCYCEWLFWQICEDVGVVRKNHVPVELTECLHKYIVKGNTDENPFGGCSDANLEKWKCIVSNTRINSIYKKIGDYQPLVLKIPKDGDFSILKLKERKNIKKPRNKRFQQYLSGSFFGTVYSVNAGRTKFIAPTDMRFKQVDGYALRSGFRPSLLRASIFGDGSWAYCGTDQRGEFNAWRLIMTPRRSEFLSPGRRVLLLGFFAVLFWQIFNIDARSGKDILNSFSMTIVGSVFIYYLKLFDVKRTHSPYFRWGIALQRRGLMVAYAAVVLFPFFSHLLKKFSFTLHKVTGGFWPYLDGVIGLIRSETLHSVIRLLIIAVLFALLVNFKVARSYGKPSSKAKW